MHDTEIGNFGIERDAGGDRSSPPGTGSRWVSRLRGIDPVGCRNDGCPLLKSPAVAPLDRHRPARPTSHPSGLTEVRRRTVTIYRSLTETQQLTSKDTLTAEPVLPGFSVSISRFF